MNCQGLLETEQVALFLHQRSADLMAQADHRAYLSLSPEYPVDVERELAQFASWYELFPRSITDDPNAPRHLQRRAFAAADDPGHGLRRVVFPADPPDRPQLSQRPEQLADGRARMIRAAPMPLAVKRAGTRRFIRSWAAAKTSADWWRPLRTTAWRSPSISPSSAPRTIHGSSSTRAGSTGGPTARSNTPRTRRRNTRTSSTSTSMPSRRFPACGSNCATSW